MPDTVPKKIFSFWEDEYPVKIIWTQKTRDFSSRRKGMWEIVQVIQGTAIHRIGGASYSIWAGDIFVVNERCNHSYSNCKELRLARVLFDFKKLEVNGWQTCKLHGFRELFCASPLRGKASVMRARLHLDEMNQRNSIALIQEIDKAEQERFPCWQMLVDCHFRHLVILLSRAYDRFLRTHDEAAERMAMATSYLQQHFREDVDFVEIEKKLNMSLRTFYRLFKRATGQAPLAYLQSLRIQYACNLLRNSNCPITQIAFDSGFEDSNYFARKFREIVGETPTAYRERWAN